MNAPVNIDQFVAEIDEKELDRISDKLAISGSKSVTAKGMIRAMIRSMLEAHNRDKYRESTFDLKDDRAALKRIGRAARKLATELESRTNGADYFLTAAWPRGEVSPDDLFAALDVLQDIAGKPGTPGNPGSSMAFLSSVLWLADIADKCDGHASIKANLKEGRLIDELIILRDLLPFNIVPDKLPYGTIARWKNIQSARRKRLTIKNGTKISRL
jgi:hypothetical protein